jgi:hypothetical protein
MTNPNSANRRRFRYSLRTLLALIVLVSVGLGWLALKMRKAERQRKAVEAIREAGGEVEYDYQRTEGGCLSVELELPAPAWLMDLVGDDSFTDVLGVGFFVPERFDEVVLEDVKGLTKLEVLNLSDIQVTDDGLGNIEGLTRLRILQLGGTQITDAGLDRLKRLTGLQRLDLTGTQVTKEGINELRKALPNCEIIWDGETAQAQTD